LFLVLVRSGCALVAGDLPRPPRRLLCRSRLGGLAPPRISWRMRPFPGGQVYGTGGRVHVAGAQCRLACPAR